MEKHLEILAKVYNTLLLVSTKGEDTIIMGQCLSTMHDTLMKIQQELALSHKTDEIKE